MPFTPPPLDSEEKFTPPPLDSEELPAPVYGDESGIPTNMSPEQRRSLDVLSRLAAERGAGEAATAEAEDLARQERSIGFFSKLPAEILNQPSRIADRLNRAMGGPPVADIFQTGKPIIKVEPAHTGPSFQAGTEKVLADTLSGFTTPEMVMSAPAAVASAPVRALFGATIAQQLPEQVENAALVLGDINSTPAEKAEAVGNPVVGTALAALLSKEHAPKAPIKPGELQAAEMRQLAADEANRLSLPQRTDAPQQLERPIEPPATTPPAEEPIVIGTQVEAVMPDGKPVSGTVIGADKEGNALLLDDKGETHTLPEKGGTSHAGEIEKDVEMDGGEPPRSTAQMAEGTPGEVQPAPGARQAGEAGLPEAPEVTELTHAEKAKLLADKIREQFKTETEGGQVFTGPVQIINAAVEIAAKIIEGGGKLADAIEAAVKHVKDNFTGEWDEAKFRARLEKIHGTASEEVETYGIAARVREKRAEQGLTGEVPPGKGIGAEESVEHGRELLAAGADAEAAVQGFEANRAISADAMALVRARGEQLAKEASEAAEKYGRESPEYKAAWEKSFAWDKRIKPMQTEWHKIGMAQQGETEIDTGTFHGLRRAFNDATGRDFTPDQAKTAEEKAGKVKKADAEADKAQADLVSHLSKERVSDAEARAKAAADKTVREATARMAQAETKKRVADESLKRDVEAIRAKAEEAAKAASDKAIREAAARKARAESKTRVNEAGQRRDVNAIREEAEARARAAADKTVREAVARAANEAIKKRERIAAEEKAAAERERQQAAKQLAEANKRAREAAIRAAKEETRNRVLQADTSALVWKKAREYIEAGMDNFDDIRTKLATDLGMPVSKVTAALAKDKRAKFLADDVWRKQQLARDLKSQAKRWLAQTAAPVLTRIGRAIPNFMFGAKVFGHGTVALGTHAPMVAFQPRFWANYIRDFGKMYKMVGIPTPKGQASARAFYEMQVQDLIRRKNYITARRAGLVNDPFTYEDYNSPDTTKYFGNISGMGNRGYSVLKILRQDMFDQHWNKLPRTMQTPEMAAAIANDVNHATGVVKGRAPPGSNLALFAPRLMGSRAMWLVGDPAKMVGTFANWKNATQAEKWSAMAQLKEKAWVAGTFFSLLALNQGILSATGSKQKINGVPKALGGGGFDPLESDFLKFKAAGLDLAYGSAMLNMAKLPVRMATAIAFEGKTSKLVLEDERVYKIAGEYLRSQASPFAGTMADLAFGRDYAGRPLPRAGFGILPGRTDIPKRLRQHGITKPYSWKEYASIQGTPIPISEGIREVWGQGLGMSPKQMDHYLKSLIIISIMAGTGGRVTEDWKVKK